MSTRIRFLGVAGYEIQGPDRRILVDPFLSANPRAPCSPDELETPDVILVSHAAYDHLGDAATISRRTGAPVVCGADVRLMLLEDGVPDQQIRATVWGIVVRVGGVVVRPIECHHWSNGQLNGAAITGTPMGFIVETEPGVRIYHYGDTAIFDMRLFGELYAPTVGIFGCTNPIELDDHGAGEMLTGRDGPGRSRPGRGHAGRAVGICLALPIADPGRRRVRDTRGRARCGWPARRAVTGGRADRGDRGFRRRRPVDLPFRGLRTWTGS